MLDPEQTFGCIGDLLVASSKLMALGFASAAQRVEAKADALLDDALEQGLDYQLELQEATEEGLQKNAAAWRWIKQRRSPKAKRWLCCTKPKKHRTRRGKQVWASMCKYKTSKRIGWMFRIVGRDPQRKPREVHMGGKKLPWCPGSSK